MKIKKFLYLIQCGSSNFYKIGISTQPKLRLQELQVGCPYTLSLIYKKYYDRACSIEISLHKKYRSKQKNREWFELSKNDLAFIQDGLSDLQELNKRVDDFLKFCSPDISASALAKILNKNHSLEYKPITPCYIGKTNSWKKHHKCLRIKRENPQILKSVSQEICQE